MNTSPTATSEETNLKPGEFTRRSGDLSLLAVNAAAAIVFTGLGGWLVYANTQHLIETRRSLEQSHETLTRVQAESRQFDGLVHDLTIYQISGNIATLQNAASSLGMVRADSVALERMVQGDGAQAQIAGQLHANLDDLTAKFAVEGSARSLPEQEIERCRSALARLEARERDVLDQRLSESKNSGSRSLRGGAVYLGFSLLAVITFFGFLVRDVVRRRREQEELARMNQRLGTTIEELQRRNDEARGLKETRDELELCVSIEQVQACAARHLQQLFPGSMGSVVLIDDSRRVLETGATWGDPVLTEGAEMEACCGLRTGRARRRRSGISELNCTHFSGPAPEDYLCAPLVAYGETLGFLFLGFPTESLSSLADECGDLVEEIVGLVSIAIAGLKLRSRLESQSIRDGLTTLFNRQFMEIALDRELHMASRRRASLAVLMLDIDDFKNFNDSYGHEAGDEVLRRVAECFSQSVRVEDVICRYGGEEFVILLPEINEPFAVERAEEIRDNVSRLSSAFRGVTLQPITVSIGLAMYPDPAKDAADLLRMADAALYEAKRAGRNQTKVARKSVTIPALHAEKLRDALEGERPSFLSVDARPE